MYMCVCVCVCVYIYIYIYMCVCVCVICKLAVCNYALRIYMFFEKLWNINPKERKTAKGNISQKQKQALKI